MFTQSEERKKLFAPSDYCEWLAILLSITLFFDPWNNLNLEHDLAVSVAIYASVQATEIAHEMKVIRLKTFAESLVDQGYRDRKLRYKIDAHPFWT